MDGQLAGRAGQVRSCLMVHFEGGWNERQYGADRWTAWGLLLGLILNLTLTDRRTAPGVSEGAVTVPWVERRVWGHETSRSRQTDRASSGGIE